MTRALLPGRWNRHGRAVPDPQPCELDGDMPPDFYRVIAPPPPLSNDMRSRAMRRALLLVALGFALLGALLGISDPRFTP